MSLSLQFPMRILLISLLFLMPLGTLFISFCFSAVSGECLGDQKSLLLRLKNSLEFDPSWSTKLGQWNQNVDCCLWEGVTCNEGRVIGLDLSNESISGGLEHSSGLFDLHYLQSLNLAGNDFGLSQIPYQFMKLKNIRTLNLSAAGFAGQIPKEIAHLTRLVTLDLSNNFYRTGDDSADVQLILENPNLATLVQKLSELRELYLDRINITAQGYEWCQALSAALPNLRVLSMSHCSLSGPLDSSLLNLQSLSIIRLDGNDFPASVLESFADFQNLTSLSLSDTNLDGIVSEKIFGVQTLQTMDLSLNYLLQGSLPEFSRNGSLQTLILSGTSISGTLPHSVGSLEMLSTMDLSFCNFSGTIPTTMTNLTRLVHLDMSHNGFTGTIPSFSMAKNITQIDLSYNALTGEITSTRWEELLMLESLYLGSNSLEGPIPGSLFSLPSLEWLDLSNNHFSGQVDEFSNTSYKLLTLDLSNNNLEGPIPMSLFELRSLDFLSLSSNNFSGYLQLTVIQKLENLSELDLSYNNLLIECSETNSSAVYSLMRVSLRSNQLKTFPDCLSNQYNLLHLDLSSNQIEGVIPEWLSEKDFLVTLNLSRNYFVKLEASFLDPPALDVLDLHSNQLQGPLPLFSTDIVHLDFSGNNFSSTLPANIGNFLGSTLFFSLSSNKFYGSIPRSICHATRLQVLDLSKNSFSGTIPQCLIERSENLMVLDLRSNDLTGVISDAFPSNCALQSLALNGNQLGGELPKSLAQCTNLVVLDMGNNHIEGAFPCYLKNTSMLRILVLRFNKFYGPIGCPGPNSTWPMLQIIDLASNRFSGKLPTNVFSMWKEMISGEEWGPLKVNRFTLGGGNFIYSFPYQQGITVGLKGLEMELKNVLTIFTSIDFSCNKFDGPIPAELGGLKLLYLLNLSHNAFSGKIPSSLGKLSQLEALDFSSNHLSGEIPVQLADGLTFLSVLNLSVNQLVGQIPFIKQFATFSETSYEGNEGLCGFPLKQKCGNDEEPGTSSPEFEKSHWKSRTVVNWNYLCVELGFVYGFGMVIGPLLFWKRWRIAYYKHIDDIFFKIFPHWYLRNEYRRRQPRRSHR